MGKRGGKIKKSTFEAILKGSKYRREESIVRLFHSPMPPRRHHTFTTKNMDVLNKEGGSLEYKASGVCGSSEGIFMICDL
jgi:hypothetical protein